MVSDLVITISISIMFHNKMRYIVMPNRMLESGRILIVAFIRYYWEEIKKVKKMMR